MKRIVLAVAVAAALGSSVPAQANVDLPKMTDCIQGEDCICVIPSIGGEPGKLCFA